MKSKSAFLHWTFIILLGLSACTKDHTVTPSGTNYYNLNFVLTESGKGLGMSQTVTDAQTRYYLTILRFYAGLPRLVKTDGTEVPLTNSFIVKFDNGISDNAVCNHSFRFPIPAGSYKAIRFGVGMPPQIRDTVTHYHFNPLDPLNSDYGMLWTMTSNGKINVFRNIAINMYADTSQAQNLPPKRFLSFHILEDDTALNLYKEVEFPDVFTVSGGDSHITDLYLDANKIFFNPLNPVDLRTCTSTDMMKADHTGISLGIKLNDNLAAALSKN